MKRMEKSRFKWPLSGAGSVLGLTVREINWLLDGYPLTVTQANGSLPHHRVLLQPDRDRQGQWHRALRLSPNRVHRVAAGDIGRGDRSLAACTE